MNTTWDVIDLVAMVVEVCIMETGHSVHDWRLKLHIPMQLGGNFVPEQVRMFTEKWEGVGPDVPVEAQSEEKN
eukprot:2484226-Prorocentrum_lima.AAC.1